MKRETKPQKRERLDQLEKLDSRELAGCQRAYQAGNIGALLSAANYCRKNKIQSPDWLIDALYELLIEAIRDAKPKKPGRANSRLRRLRQDLIHFARWDTVTMIREKQNEAAKELAELLKLADVDPKFLKMQQEFQMELGTTWEAAFEYAAMSLRGTDAFAGPDAMKHSYYKVKQHSEEETTALRYRLPDRQTIKALGLDPVFEKRSVKKPR